MTEHLTFPLLHGSTTKALPKGGPVPLSEAPHGYFGLNGELYFKDVKDRSWEAIRVSDRLAADPDTLVQPVKLI